MFASTKHLAQTILSGCLILGGVGCDDTPEPGPGGSGWDNSACDALSGFDYTDLSQLNPDLFPGQQEMYDELRTMVDFGPRHTASKADNDYIDYVESRMVAMGLKDITRDPVQVDGLNLLSWPSAPTSGTAHHIYGILPGMTEEIIVLGVHSDGQNSIEENGVPVLLEIAEYLTKVPEVCRRHTFALVFPTSHMATSDSQEAAGWATKHPDVMEDAVAFVSPEHLGHLVNGEPLTFELMGTSANMRSKSQEIINEMGFREISVGSTGIGTGGAWRAISGKPTLAGMTSPVQSYLGGLVNPSLGIDRVDKRVFYDSTVFFARMVGYLDGLSEGELSR